MGKNYTIEELAELFWKIEQENDLLNMEINNVKFWSLIRFNVFAEILMQKGLTGQAHTKNRGMRIKLKALYKLFLNSFKRNPLKGYYRKEYLIFTHKRKVKIDNQFMDIYTNDFIEELNKSDYEIIDTPYSWEHFVDKNEKNIKYIDSLLLKSYILNYLPVRLLNQKDFDEVRKIENLISVLMGVKIPLIKQTQKAIRKFHIHFKYYSKLIKKRNPSKIFLVVSYGLQALIAAAKENNVKVIEFQHGVITPFHIAYSYPHISHEIDYFPDVILTFGDYWNKATTFPKGVDLKVYGFPFLKKRLELYREVKQENNKILFISQGTIGRQLSTFAYEIARTLQGYEIVYKLHPGEYERWRDIYPTLVQATNLNNFKIIDNNDKELYYYFAQAQYVCGVYSTAIYESLAFNCKIILYNINGIEHMKDLINNDIVKLVNNKEEFKKELNNFNNGEFNSSYFFY